MSSFFSSSSSYKPQAQIRQEGFHPQDPSFDLFAPFVPDALRKFPPGPAMDLADELAFIDRAPRPPHNIFDVSAPDYPPHFNQTLPALNSSLRYENDPPAYAPHLPRHTPSPTDAPPSRSPSRPPSSAGPPPALGPARTARARRNNSVGGTSPPPARPHAIVIPRSRAATVSANGSSGWYLPSHSTASDLSLPTPDSLHHHSPPQIPYSPFALSPPPDALHLPPVSALHALHPQSYLHHGSPHSLPNIHTSLPVPAAPPAPSPASSPPDPKPPTAADKQAILANEKRRRRRESHNAVERRRRDNINEKISELATLIPECMLDVSGTPNNNPVPNSGSPTNPPPDDQDWKKEPGATSPDANNSNSGTPPPPPSAVSVAAAGPDGVGIVKANKGMILRKSVEYIRYLQQLVEAQGARNRELEAELKAWRAGADPVRAPVNGDQGQAVAWNGAGYAGNAGYFGLPSMPEGGEDGEEDEEEREGSESGMEVEESERGRTRVQGKLKRKKAVVKEEGGRAEEMMML
ncbi:hypothetical protein E4T56_gene3122 [Termitomyces sp. T112]|nr:hypothetical protein E4T56_gene3122 [Termitomyces sp. T112]